MTISSGSQFQWLPKANRKKRMKINVESQSRFSPHSKTLANNAETIQPSPQLTKILIEQARGLQMLPDVAVQALAIIDDPNSEIPHLVNVIAQDPKLSTDIISLANSAIFGCVETTACLEKSIGRVGFRPTKNMVFASSITSMMQKMDWQEEWIRELLSKHSMLTGVIASQLNKLFKTGLQGEEFTAGLIHDIGRTLLAVSIPQDFEAIDPLSFNESAGLLDHEIESIGTTHAEVGAWFLQRNHLPEELVAVARYHHAPQKSAKFKRLIAITAIADEMANFYQREGREDGFQCDENENLRLLESLGVDDATEILQEFSGDIFKSSINEVSQIIKF